MKKLKNLTWIYIGNRYQREDKDIFDFLKAEGIKFVFCPTENYFWEFIVKEKIENLQDFGIIMDLSPSCWPITTIHIPKTQKTEERICEYHNHHYCYWAAFYEAAILPYGKPPIIILYSAVHIEYSNKKDIDAYFLHKWEYKKEYKRIFEGE